MVRRRVVVVCGRWCGRWKLLQTSIAMVLEQLAVDFGGLTLVAAVLYT
jgi:hypothetical protein